MSKSEDALRKRIVSILKNTEGIQSVKDRCSPIEYGIDITFERKDPFGEYRLFGVQIKVGSISPKKRVATKLIKEIVGQISIAYGHQFPTSVGPQFLDGVYVVIDGEVNPFADEIFSSARAGFRNTHLISAEKLTRFLKEGEAGINILKQT